jgi:hypothetical protein
MLDSLRRATTTTKKHTHTNIITHGNRVAPFSELNENSILSCPNFFLP